MTTTARLLVELEGMQEAFYAKNIRFHHSLVDSQLKQQRVFRQQLATKQEIRELEKLIEYVKADMDSPRYKELSPAAKDVVDISYRDHTRGLERAEQKLTKIKNNLAAILAEEEAVLTRHRRYQDEFEAQMVSLRARLPAHLRAVPESN